MQVATHPLYFFLKNAPSQVIIKCDVISPLEKQAALKNLENLLHCCFVDIISNKMDMKSYDRLGDA